jgi:hypothetical protein
VAHAGDAKRGQRLVYPGPDLTHRQSQVLQAPGYFLLDRGTEELDFWFLEQDSYPIGQGGRWVLMGVSPGDEDAALHLPPGETGSQPSQKQAEGGLSSVTGAHDRQPLAITNAQVQIVDYPRGRLIG